MSSKATGDTPSEQPNKVACGVIMPIADTARFSATQWARVQTLIHRVINQSGFEPKNIWELDSADRISERIIANIFRYELAVADISDLNSNVMLELGLRLSSKKPTVVISDSDQEIPFDIRDFEVIKYPKDLNMLDMEIFFENFSEKIKGKHSAFKSGKYQPFLGQIIVEVASPTEKSSTIDDIILSRIDNIDRKLGLINRPYKYGETPLEGILPPNSRTASSLTTKFIAVKISDEGKFISGLSGLPNYTLEEMERRDGTVYYKISAPNEPSGLVSSSDRLAAYLSQSGAIIGVPKKIVDAYNARIRSS